MEGYIETDDPEKPSYKELKISDLGDHTLELTKRIPVLLEIYSDEVFAENGEIGLCSSGETEEEAIYNLKNNITYLYHELTEDEENLGPLVQLQLIHLRKFIRE